ncbi:MAG TPA: D-glycero-beta-D-manno-heptose 1-phosphate adenylyltransferase [Gemmatimonadales bacterium]|nr:D-glycero-beta-D-manno-heptose 1-phosphate adenylyltransferase [Gemmatimonadales bacterium]
MSHQTKIRTAEDATAWRSTIAGPLVFTNGVFDLLHPGHVAYLESARLLGGALVVGVNTDRSVRSLAKGADRPLVAEADRAAVVAGLASVDCVVTFDEPTPLTLIERLRPDVLVKGGDYTRETMVGAAEVESWGGRAVILPLSAGYSTTTLVERLRATS